MADLLGRVGNMPPERIWLNPRPGTAMEKDVIAAWSGLDRRLCELVHGTLVEKMMGTKEAVIALRVGHYLLIFVPNKTWALCLAPTASFA
jgi:hypothetical protein